MKVSVKSKFIRSNRESGFTLIEVTIGLLITGLIVAALIAAYNIKMLNDRHRLAGSNLNVIDAALYKYQQRTGRYPRPSDPSVQMVNAGFGTEVAIPGAGFPLCAPNSILVCRTPGVTASGVGSNVLIGAVPTAELGISSKLAFDPFGKRLKYAVTASMAAPGAADRDGAINIVDRNNNQLPFLANARAHYVIVSHGRDGWGAIGGNAIPIACGTNLNSADFENCNNDAAFKTNELATDDALIFEGAGPTKFDDYIKYTISSIAGTWSFRADNSNNADFLQNGNIRIGAAQVIPPPPPSSRLDVNGNVRANVINTDRICKSDDQYCTNFQGVSTTPNPRFEPNPSSPVTQLGWFSPPMLTGAPDTPPATGFTDSGTNGIRGGGIRCYNNKGLRGIKDYDEVCTGSGSAANPKPTSGSLTGPATCGSGGVTGIRFNATRNQFQLIC